MNIFNVFLPVLLSILYFLLVFFLPIGSFLVAGTLSYSIFHNKSTNTYDNKVFGLNINQFIKVFSGILLIVFFFCFIALFNILSSSWIRANPEVDDKSKMGKAGSVIVLGFGLDEDKHGNLLPGRANMQLHNWIENNIQNKTVIAQYGNLLAQENKPSPNHYILLHEHDTDNYIDTYEAIVYAFDLLDSLYNRGEINRDIILLAHDMQIQRAQWIFEKLSESKKEWQEYNFITPEIPKIHFSLSSTQFHTKMRFIYSCTEIFYSRPRDYFKKGME